MIPVFFRAKVGQLEEVEPTGKVLSRFQDGTPLVFGRIWRGWAIPQTGDALGTAQALSREGTDGRVSREGVGES